MITNLLIALTIVTLIQAKQSLRLKRQAFQDDHLDCSHGEGYYQHPKDCRFYYHCVGHQTGDYQRFVFACPHLTVFDTEYNVCTLASLAAPCNTQEQRLIPVKDNNNYNYPSTGKPIYNVPVKNNNNNDYPSTRKPIYNVPLSTSGYNKQGNNPPLNGQNDKEISTVPDDTSYPDYFPYTDYPNQGGDTMTYETPNVDQTNGGFSGYNTAIPKSSDSNKNMPTTQVSNNKGYGPQSPSVSTSKSTASYPQPPFQASSPLYPEIFSKPSVGYPQPPFQSSSPLYPEVTFDIHNGQENPDNTISGKINTQIKNNPSQPDTDYTESDETYTDSSAFKTDRPVFKTSTKPYGPKFPISDASITSSPGSNYKPTPRQGGGTTTVTQVCQAPTISVKPVFCQGQGFFRHPENCSQFYQCISNIHGDMESYIFNCPKGLVFQEDGQQQCTHAKDVPECSQEISDQPTYSKVY